MMSMLDSLENTEKTEVAVEPAEGSKFREAFAEVEVRCGGRRSAVQGVFIHRGTKSILTHLPVSSMLC